MSKRDDIDKLYKVPNYLEKIELIFFLLNIILSIAILYVKKYMVETTTIILIILDIVFFIINIVDDVWLWYEAENARRKNCIENGFGIRLSELETEDYYNNKCEESMEKYALNILESNFYSKTIAEKMIWKSFIKSVIAIIILIVVFRTTTVSGVLYVIVQVAFSTYIFRDTITLCIYTSKMNRLYDDGYRLLITLGYNGKSRNVMLLNYAENYEFIKAYYKVRLKERTFNKYNESLDEEWKKIISHKK